MVTYKMPGMNDPGKYIDVATQNFNNCLKRHKNTRNASIRMDDIRSPLLILLSTRVYKKRNILILQYPVPIA